MSNREFIKIALILLALSAGNFLYQFLTIQDYHRAAEVSVWQWSSILIFTWLMKI
jgi:hypothetical protein